MRYKFILQKDDLFKEAIYDTIENSIYLDGINLKNTSINKCSSQSNNELLINIYMGGACNYKCEYCIQSECMKSIKKYDKRDIKSFVKQLFDYSNKHFSECDSYKVLVWGGEPLVYFDIMKELYSEIKTQSKYKFFYGFCTNGSLITDEVLKWVSDNEEIGFSLSYDGPGQYLRNKDDVLDTNTSLLNYFKTNKDWSINPVWTKANKNLTKFIEYVTAKVGHSDWKIGDNSQFLIVNDDKILDYCLTEQELQELIIDVCRHIHEQNDKIIRNYFHHAVNFITHLNNTTRTYKCTNSHPNAKSINVDLEGNIWVCQSAVNMKEDDFGGNLYIGTLSSERNKVEFKEYDDRYDTRCINCVMKNICSGGCPLTGNKYRENNCLNNWYRAYPTLYMAVNMLTEGYQLIGIEKMYDC